jgi:hypothetical protein
MYSTLLILALYEQQHDLHAFIQQKEKKEKKTNTAHTREDLRRTKLSCGRMIQQLVSLSQFSCVSLVQLTDRRGGRERRGAEKNHSTRKNTSLGPL